VATFGFSDVTGQTRVNQRLELPSEPVRDLNPGAGAGVQVDSRSNFARDLRHAEIDVELMLRKRCGPHAVSQESIRIRGVRRLFERVAPELAAGNLDTSVERRPPTLH
jgi:hypothetical protein